MRALDEKLTINELGPKFWPLANSFFLLLLDLYGSQRVYDGVLNSSDSLLELSCLGGGIIDDNNGGAGVLHPNYYRISQWARALLLVATSAATDHAAAVPQSGSKPNYHGPDGVSGCSGSGKCSKDKGPSQPHH